MTYKDRIKLGEKTFNRLGEDATIDPDVAKQIRALQKAQEAQDEALTIPPLDYEELGQ